MFLLAGLYIIKIKTRPDISKAKKAYLFKEAGKLGLDILTKKPQNEALQFNFFVMLIKKLVLGKMVVTVFFKPGFLTKLFPPFCHFSLPRPTLA